MDFAELIERTDRAAQRHLGAVKVMYRPSLGDPVEVEGIFDEAYRLSEEGEAGVETVTPAISFRLEDLPLHPNEDEPEIWMGDTVYSVRERQPDSMGGMIRLLLTKDKW